MYFGQKTQDSISLVFAKLTHLQFTSSIWQQIKQARKSAVTLVANKQLLTLKSDLRHRISFGKSDPMELVGERVETE